MDIIQMIQSLFTHFQTNNFLSGGFILMVIGAIAAYFRNLPLAIWSNVKGQLFISLEINSQDELFRWVETWVSKHAYTKRTRRLVAFTYGRKYRHFDEDDSIQNSFSQIGEKKKKIPDIYCGPAPGYHFFFFKNRLFVLEREREKIGGQNSGFISLYETFYIKIFTRNKKIVEEFLNQLSKMEAEKYEEKIKVFIPDGDYWYNVGAVESRPLESVILDDGKKERIVSDLKEFINKKKWYESLGIPYRKGFLFYGPPGCGKSSLAIALAKEFSIDLYALSLSSEKMDDSTLNKLFTETNNSIVLIEDIDCIFDKRKQAGNSKVTFSGLLNAIDGVYSGSGRILIMTTNHIKKLDPALIRPGRVDLKVEFKKASFYQTKEFYKRFHENQSEEEAEAFAKSIKPFSKSPAELQSIFQNEIWIEKNKS